MEILKLHSTGENVRELLKILGIFADGIYGKLTESLVKLWLKDNGLVPDGIVGEKTWNRLNSTILSPEIVYNPINVHISKLPNRTIKYLVIHFTAGASSKEGSALKNREVFLTRDASADYVVDDATILQVNPDPFNYYCWAVGDGKGKNGIYNKDCISIELCSNLKPGTTAKVPNHEGWYFTEATIDNAVKLSKLLMKRYNIPYENVIRHKDVSQKNCPGIIGWNDGPIYDPITGKKTDTNNNSSEWTNFKNKLK